MIISIISASITTIIITRLTSHDLDQLLATKACDVCRLVGSHISLKLMLSSTKARCIFDQPLALPLPRLLHAGLRREEERPLDPAQHRQP